MLLPQKSSYGSRSIIILLLLSLVSFSDCQIEFQTETQHEQPEANCSKFYRNLQRHGVFLTGQVKIPVEKIKNTKVEENVGSEHGFQLQMKFSRSVRAVHVRQAKAKDMGGTHTEFMIDTTVKDGVMKLDTTVRLRSLRGHLPSVTRIVFNNKALCGPPLSESELNESIVVDAVNKKIELEKTSSTKSSRYTLRTTRLKDSGIGELNSEEYDYL